MIHNEILLQNKNILQIQCKSCKSKEHTEINCPLLHYEVDLKLFINRHTSS
jgi:hypothetical protein